MQYATELCKTILAFRQIPALLILLISFITFCLYGIDKWKALTNRFRISEKTLLFSTALFGGIGAFLGMQLFRHKTNHLQFRILVPLFLILQIAVIVAVIILGTFF